MQRLGICWTAKSHALLGLRAVSVAIPSCAKAGSRPSPKLLDPEERLGYLRTAEKRVAVLAGVSLLVGYIALKWSVRAFSTNRMEHTTGQPRPLVVAGPSGSGKSTLLGRLFREYPDSFGFSISHTTRKPREGEKDGREYHFTSREAMKKSIEAGHFIEWAEYSGNMYGTSKQAVTSVLSTGKVCVLDIDMQGVRSVKKTDLNPVYLLIRPPSMAVLEERLRHRDSESPESLKKRLDVAQEEMEYGEMPGVFDHVVVNDTVDLAYLQLKAAITKDIGIIEAPPTSKS